HLVIEVLDTPAHLSVGRDGLDGVLEAQVGDGVALARLEGERPAALRTFATCSLLVSAVVLTAAALHGPPPGRLPRSSRKTRIHPPSMASVHNRSPMRRRRVSPGSFWPRRSRATYSSRNRPRRASAFGPSRSSIVRASPPSTQSVTGTLMPNF